MRKFFLKSFVIVFSVFNFLVSCGGDDENNCPEYSPLPSTFEISGSVKNEENQYVEGINVEIPEKELKTETDSDGKFFFEGILSGENPDEFVVVVKDKDNIYEETEKTVTVVKIKDAEYEGKCIKPVSGSHYQADNVVIAISNNKIVEDIDSILENAQIANNSITVTFSDESVFYYQTCMPLPVVKEDGKSEKMKNNPWECYIEATSLCGYWLDDEYQLPSGPGCDIVECKKAAGLSFVEFIGNYTAEEFKDIPEEHENSSCDKAPVSVAVPYKGKFTAELTLFTDENCKESVTASASFEN